MNLVPWTKRNRFGADDFWAPFPVSVRQWFGDVLDRENSGFDQALSFNPRLDVTEDNEAYRVSVELPGVDPKDVDVSIESGVLTLRGEKKEESEKKDHNVHRVERRYGSFSRSISFPVNVDAEKIKADYRNGILEIALPKAESSKPKRIEVSIGK